jgi:diaminopimelate decarboxylase
MEKSHQKTIEKLNQLFNSETKDRAGNLNAIAWEFLKEKDLFLKKAQENQTPFYLFDKPALLKAIENFQKEFKKNIPTTQIYYAMKCNDYSPILETVVSQKMGIDVSSGRELTLAIEAGCQKMVFSGPAKTNAELELALQHASFLTLHLDSFTELRRIGEIAEKHQQKIKVGIRINTKYHGRWTKLGIPLADLSKFWKEALKYKFIQLEGIQCHMSWNESAKPYELIIQLIAKTLQKDFTPQMLKTIKFIDLGGGFTPYQKEGYYPWATTQGKILKTLGEHFDEEFEYGAKYYVSQSVSLKTFAQGIANAIKKYLEPIVGEINYYFEPGRIIASDALHVLLKVMDVKNNFAITDGGTNITGWEKTLNAYAPIINLTHPSQAEIPFRLYGSLCTPDDIWGYYCYASKIEEGDLILLPNRGAYTYSLSQNFIKPIPEVYILE